MMKYTLLIYGVLLKAAWLLAGLVPFRASRHAIRAHLRQRLSRLTALRNARLVRRIGGGRKRVRVAFLVVFDSCFQMETLFQILLKDSRFDPVIYVIPDVARGEEHMRYELEKTYRVLKQRYGEKVLRTDKGKDFVDIAGLCDICAAMNPYAKMTLKQYSIEELAHRGKLVVFAKYYLSDGTIWDEHFKRTFPYGYCWRYFSDSRDEISSVVAEKPHLREVLTYTGSLKIDRFESVTRYPRNRKRIIIAPHHTVRTGSAQEFCIGNFLSYAEFFLSLPSRFPEIDWVFRPHPLLFVNLVNNGIWTQGEVDEYLLRLRAFSNCEYQEGGDYAETFMNSDGLIQDCGSFLPEYFFTNRMQCYLLASVEAQSQQFPSVRGRRLMERVFRAYAQDDVLEYIENVVTGKWEDEQTELRRWAQSELSETYPHASERAYQVMLEGLGMIAQG